MVYISHIQNVLKSETESFLTESNNRVATIINNRMKQTLESLSVLSYVLGTEFGSDLNSVSALDLLSNEKEILGLERLSVVLPDGKYFSNDGNVINVTDRDYFIESMQGKIFLSSVIESRISGENILALSVPIKKENQVVGVLVGIHEVETLQNFFGLDTFNSTGISYVTNSKGESLFSSHGTEIIFDTFINIGDDFRFIDTLDGYKVDIESVLSYRLSGSGSFYVDGLPWYISYKPLQVGDWYLFSLIAASSMDFASSDLLLFSVFICFIGILGLVVILILFAYAQAINRKQLNNLAYEDSVTGGGNVNWFKDKVNETLDREFSTGTYAFVVLNVEGFKVFNGTFGHEEGDKLLLHIYNCISKQLDEKEYVARIVNDIYCILMYYTEPFLIVNKIESIVNAVNKFQSNKVSKYLIPFNCGVYQINETSPSFLSMYDHASFALKNGRNSRNGTTCVNFYEEESRQDVLREKQIENKMEYALANNQFKVYLQPKYHLRKNRIEGAEALIRWIDPDEGILPPDQFIPLFEKNGFILNIDIYVFQQVCIAIRKWINNDIEPMVISVNLSRSYLDNPYFLEIFEQLIHKYQVPPKYIELEFTETIVYDNLEHLIGLINEIHRIGFTCSLDDFGSGYSSLNMLKNVPVDVLKLDKGFFDDDDQIQNGHKIARADAVVESVLDLAKRLNMKTVSEGIENQEQVAFLRNANCDMVQGYIFSKPLPIKDFELLAFGKSFD